MAITCNKLCKMIKYQKIPKYVALSNKKSVILRNKFKRLGLEGAHVDSILDLADELGFQETLATQPLGVRFSTVKTPIKRKKIWKA